MIKILKKEKYKLQTIISSIIVLLLVMVVISLSVKTHRLSEQNKKIVNDYNNYIENIKDLFEKSYTDNQIKYYEVNGRLYAIVSIDAILEHTNTSENRTPSNIIIIIPTKPQENTSNGDIVEEA